MAVRRHPYALLTGLAVLVALPYALFGVGFVLDDWLALGNARFDGALAAAGRDYWLNRPGQGAVWALTFGLIGAHPLVHYVAQVALNAATAVLLYRLLLRFLDTGPALGVAALWLVVPNHGSLVRWSSANMILVSLALLLGAALLLTRAAPSVRADAVAALLMVLAVLCYEATAPAAAIAAVVLPRWVSGRWRWRASLVALVGIGVAVGWVLLHLNPSKRGVNVTADLSRVFPAHFGWGVVPAGMIARLLAVAALVGLTVVGVRALAIGKGERRVEWLVPVGLAVIAIGTLPFVRYFYEPVGVGDRVNVVAGIGTALCWYGLGRLLWQWRRWVGAIGAGLVVAAMSAATVEGAWDWHRAARSAQGILAALPAETPAGTIVVGPRMPVTGNVAPFMDRSTIEPAVRMRLGDRLATATLSRNETEFAAVPAELRIDVRAVGR